MKNKTAGFWGWIRQPSSWVALIAAGISIATFFLVHAYPGDLVVALPDRVGVKLTPAAELGPAGTGISPRAPGELSVFLPITLTNTGAPRTWRHVTRLQASLIPRHSARAEAPVELAWQFEHRFVGRRQYLNRYPTAVDVGTSDYTDYEGRAFPFALRGGESVTKLFELQGEIQGQDLSEMEGFTLRVAVETGRETEERVREFSCRDEPSTEIVQWCNLGIGR